MLAGPPGGRGQEGARQAHAWDSWSCWYGGVGREASLPAGLTHFCLVCWALWGWFLFFFSLFIFVFGCAGSVLLHGLFLLVASQGYSLFVGCGLLTAVTSPVVECGL